MRTLYKSKHILITLLMLMLFKASNLPLYNFSTAFSDQRVDSTLLSEHTASSASILLQRVRFSIEQRFTTHDNNILNIYSSWKSFLILLFAFTAVIIDYRKLIIRLVKRYFEGSKYKDLLSFSQQ